MSSRDLVDIFKEKEDVFDLETIMYVAFMEYKNRKRSREIYNIYDFIPQNLIKLYYSRDTNHSDFSSIVSNFKAKYLDQESKLEGAHTAQEIAGLSTVYDYIRSDDWKKCPNIYIIYELNLKLFSKTPHPEAGGMIRTSNCYLKNSNLSTCPYDQIDKAIASLYLEFDELLKRGIEIGNEVNLSNEDRLIEYINDCLKLKCKLIQIHPFQDGNGRTMRALVNLLFKLANLPPIYVEVTEKSEYLDSLKKVDNENDYRYINKFYYYKICDSILELDVNKRIKKIEKAYKGKSKSLKK